MKGLEALKEIKGHLEFYDTESHMNIYKSKEAVEIVEKELKALEIIHKYLDIDKLIMLIIFYSKDGLVIKEKERDLLREVLKNE